MQSLLRTKTPDQGPVDDQKHTTRVARSPRHSALIYAALGSAATITFFLVHRRYFRRYQNGDWVPPDVLKKKRWIRGVVTSVGDADNFRLYHTPRFGWNWPFKFRRVPTNVKDLKDQTLHIRIAGVDAPEGSHFGRPAQAYSAESLAWLKNEIEGKVVRCQLLRRDQYARIIAVVLYRKGFLSRHANLSLEMLRAGQATVYAQAYAQYGPLGKDEFLKLEKEAQSVESPCSYVYSRA